MSGASGQPAPPGQAPQDAPAPIQTHDPEDPPSASSSQPSDVKADINMTDLNKAAALEEPETPKYADVTYWDIAKEFSILGYIGFGGPAAHIGLFQKRVVNGLRWMSEGLFLELFALGGCLPGPTSTQVSFAMGAVKKGVLGGLLSGALFQYPGAFIMTAFGIASAKVLKDPPFWLSCCASGVSAVGVALVATASKGLLIKICNTKETAIIGTLAAGAVIYWNSFPWMFPLVIFCGALITWVTNTFIHKQDMALKGDGEEVGQLGINMYAGAGLVVFWGAILAVVIVLVRTLDYNHRTEDTPLDWFEVFYRTGSIIYGGGQVVLPMLLGDLVKQDCSVTPCVEDTANSWMTTQQFYAGLGLVQAMPGPLFNFSAYLGAIIAWNAGYFPLIGVVVCWFGLFTPGVVLMFACLPYWKRFRKWNVYRRALPGMNSASVGLILASVFRMTLDVYDISPFPLFALVIGLFAFTAVDQLNIPEPIVVVGGILLGLIGWGAKLH